MSKPVENISDHRIAQALAHPLRVSVLSRLEQGPSSPVELARALNVQLENLSYHVRKLRDLGFVEMSDHQYVRGAVKHVYRLVARPHIDETAWQQLPRAAKEAIWASSMQESWRLATAAIEQGGMDRQDSYVVRSSLTLDDEGFEEIAGLLADFLERADDVERRACQRLARHGVRQCNGTLVTLFFETPALEAMAETPRPIDEHHHPGEPSVERVS